MVDQVYGSQPTSSFPIQQQVLLATLLLIFKKEQIKEVTVGNLIVTYANVLKRRKMEVPNESECIGKFCVGKSIKKYFIVFNF